MANQIDIRHLQLTDFMAALGQEKPIVIDGNLYRYNLPYDNDKSGSMLVNIETNQWRDVKSGAYGGVYDLAHEITGTCSMAMLNQFIKGEMSEFLKSKEDAITLNNKTMAKKTKKGDSPAVDSETADVKVENTNSQSQKETKAQKKEEAKVEIKEPREPQMVTVNGAKVTHGHIFQSNVNPEDWFFSVRVDGQQLRNQHISSEDVAAYQKKEIGVKELMERYHPTKLQKQLSPEELKAGNTLSDGRVIDKFSVYKEQNAERQDFGKYKIFAQVGDVKVSALATKEATNAYFDKVATPAQLVEKHLGEKLNLASAYAKYTAPEGVKVENARVLKDRSGDWVIRAKVNGDDLPGKNLSYEDGRSFFKHKTVTADQLAAKYFAPEMKVASLSTSQQQSVSKGMKI